MADTSAIVPSEILPRHSCLINKDRLRQQEEPILDSDEEITTDNATSCNCVRSRNMTPLKNCQDSQLKTAEKIHLFQPLKEMIQEDVEPTQEEEQRSPFDYDESYHRKSLRQQVIEEAEGVLMDQIGGASTTKDVLIGLQGAAADSTMLSDEVQVLESDQSMSTLKLQKSTRTADYIALGRSLNRQLHRINQISVRNGPLRPNFMSQTSQRGPFSRISHRSCYNDEGTEF